MTLLDLVQDTTYLFESLQLLHRLDPAPLIFCFLYTIDVLQFLWHILNVPVIRDCMHLKFLL